MLIELGRIVDTIYDLAVSLSVTIISSLYSKCIIKHKYQIVLDCARALIVQGTIIMTPNNEPEISNGELP